MSRLHYRNAVLVSIICLVFPGTSSAEAPAIEVAHRAYHQGRFQDSLNLYQQLAASGNAEAAERAGYMLMQGPGAYGLEVPLDAARAIALLEQAAAAGRPHAAFMLGLMNGSD